MGQVLHGSARTTEAVRRAIQHSKESLRALAKRHGVNQKTVAKWKKRTAVKDLPTGPKDAHSTVLSIEEEAIVVAFRKHTLLPLDDCLYALQATIPHLTRSSLHRCLQRHGISRLPEVTGNKEPKRKCLIPRFDGAILSLEWKEAAWDRYVMGAPRPRTPSEQQYSDRRLRSRR